MTINQPTTGHRLEGRVALITGAARGQGLEIARVFVSEGAKVVLSDVLDDEGAQAAADLGDSARYIHLDVTDELSWQQAIDFAATEFGPVTALVNNAGIMHFAPLQETTPEIFHRILAVNTVGPFLGMRAVAPGMSEAGGGTIVNTSSINGFQGVAGTSAYGSSKWALRGLTRTAAMELGHDGIRVNVIAPGTIATKMVAPDGVDAMPPGAKAVFDKLPLPRIGLPSDIANAVLFLSSAESAYVTGTELLVDGGSTAGPVYENVW